MSNFIDPELSQTTQVDIPEHEILLSFNADSHAVHFCDWWNLNGLKLFKAYMETVDQ